MESSSGIQASLGGRYASALFELAEADKALPAVEQSLQRLTAAIGESAELRALIVSPRVNRGAAGDALAKVASELGLDLLTTKFLGVLAQNRRLAALPDIARAFSSMAAAHRGESHAKVVSAHPLTDAQADAIGQQLRARLGRAVHIDRRVDPDLLGGLIVKVGSKLFDSSIRTRLNALAAAMKG